MGREELSHLLCVSTVVVTRRCRHISSILELWFSFSGSAWAEDGKENKKKERNFGVAYLRLGKTKNL